MANIFNRWITDTLDRREAKTDSLQAQVEKDKKIAAYLDGLSEQEVEDRKTSPVVYYALGGAVLVSTVLIVMTLRKKKK